MGQRAEGTECLCSLAAWALQLGSSSADSSGMCLAPGKLGTGTVTPRPWQVCGEDSQELCLCKHIKASEALEVVVAASPPALPVLLALSCGQHLHANSRARARFSGLHSPPPGKAFAECF